MCRAYSAWRVVGPQRVRIVCDDSPDCQKTFPPVPRSTSRRRNRGRRGCVIPYRCPRCRSLPASPRLSLRPVRSGTTRKHACEPPTEMESSVEEIAASTLDASALFHPDDESPHTRTGARARPGHRSIGVRSREVAPDHPTDWDITCSSALRRDHPQPTTRRRGTRRPTTGQGTRNHTAPQDHRRPRSFRPTATLSTRPTPARPLALGHRMAAVVACRRRHALDGLNPRTLVGGSRLRRERSLFSVFLGLSRPVQQSGHCVSSSPVRGRGPAEGNIRISTTRSDPATRRALPRRSPPR